jgi:hypothetical protein
MWSGPVEFTEGIVPLGDMKVNPGKILRRIDETGGPGFLANHGPAGAVAQTPDACEAAQPEKA